VRAVNMRYSPDGALYDVVLTDRVTAERQTIANLKLPMVGQHNVLNSLAAVAIAREMGIDQGVLRKALAEFRGVKRRFTKTGEAMGLTVIDDYGHHPVEIAAVLKAARQASRGRVLAVVQPHRYTRLRDLFEEFCTCFNEADTVIVAPVYAAGEPPIEGIDRDALLDGLRRHGHRHVLALEQPEELVGLIASVAVPGDLVVCLGAGSITQWAQALPAELAQLGTRIPREASR